MKKLEYGCRVCKKTQPKSTPYGAKRGKYWCSKCDRDMVSSVSKKRERRLAKKAIKNET